MSLLRATSSSLLRSRLPSSITTGSTVASNPSQWRCISLLRNAITSSNPERQADLDRAVEMVKSHDPVGYLPGRLLPSSDMQEGYYVVRSFWVETGFRFSGSTNLPASASPAEQLAWWQEGIHDMYKHHDGELSEETRSHPTFRLLYDLLERHDLSQKHFDDVLSGRRKDLDMKQYPTLDSLVEHAALSCGSLLQLVLQCGHISSPSALKAAHSVGICHGLTNALRTSIPVMSTTGKLIIPQDLCVKYGVRNPRYLLSALGQGDVKCLEAFQNVIRDIVEVARQNLQDARAERGNILAEEPQAVAVLLPGLASETFLYRLERSNYDLTDKNLRNVGFVEHALCAGRMISAYSQQTY